jgi:hypothetical protein
MRRRNLGQSLDQASQYLARQHNAPFSFAPDHRPNPLVAECVRDNERSTDMRNSNSNNNDRDNGRLIEAARELLRKGPATPEVLALDLAEQFRNQGESAQDFLKRVTQALEKAGLSQNRGMAPSEQDLRRQREEELADHLQGKGKAEGVGEAMREVAMSLEPPPAVTAERGRAVAAEWCERMGIR